MSQAEATARSEDPRELRLDQAKSDIIAGISSGKIDAAVRQDAFDTIETSEGSRGYLVNNRAGQSVMGAVIEAANNPAATPEVREQAAYVTGRFTDFVASERQADTAVAKASSSDASWAGGVSRGVTNRAIQGAYGDVKEDTRGTNLGSLPRGRHRHRR